MDQVTGQLLLENSRRSKVHPKFKRFENCCSNDRMVVPKHSGRIFVYEIGIAVAINIIQPAL